MFLEPFGIFVPLCVLVLWQLVRFLRSVQLQDSYKTAMFAKMCGLTCQSETLTEFGRKFSSKPPGIIPSLFVITERFNKSIWFCI